ncbi:NAD+ kinase [Cryobacterium lactosi]|uniref:NAD+ kinase n=2 Tax=Cryobacterium lactosi TaxID=1259202 RepID=A0A4R9BWA1_9MICO|nr:NAD+ kinase [Cryobacterium lactosi]
MGGRVGLKGSDGAATVQEARRRGAQPQASERAHIALSRLAAAMPGLRVLTAGEDMGETAARAVGFTPLVVHRPEEVDTVSADTQVSVAAMSKAGVDLILFVGGDGTARDVLASKAQHIPMLGIPAGVKMHSAVFGTSPQNAGQLAALHLARDSAAAVREAEVMDLDEDAIREDRVSARLYGYALSPYERRLSQNAKAGAGPGEEATLDAIARKVAARMRSGVLYVLGPGTTTRRVSTSLGLPSTLLGVDAVLDGRLVGRDLDEQGLLRLMADRESYLVVGVLGGQGSLFGRGNQQISAEVIRRTGRDHIIVVAALEKLISLDGEPLRVDTGDAEVDTMLTGHIRVRTGLEQDTVYRVQA